MYLNLHYGPCSADCFRKIVRQEGTMALWTGTLPSLLLVSNPAIQFIGYESLKRNLQFLLDRQVCGS